MSHVRGAPFHPQTQGKIERWHQTLKNRILLENGSLPGGLEAQIEAFVEHYTLGVIEDRSLSMFIVGSLVATGSQVRRRLAGSIWMPEWQVAGGDTVLLHTGKGLTHREQSEDGRRTLHHIHMIRSRPIWTSKRRRAVLIEILEKSMMNPKDQ